MEAGAYVKDRTPRDAVFVTGTQHLNPVVAIAGRTIVCGTERQEELLAFYEDPAGHPEVPEKYGAEYVYVSSYELNSYDVDLEGMSRIGVKVFENDEAAIYKLHAGMEDAG